MSVSHKQKKLKIAATVIRIILILVFITIFILLIYQNSCPAGQLSISYQIGRHRPHFISSLEPEYRVSGMVYLAGRSAQILISNPVYFNIRTVLPFQKARIQLVYQNSNNYLLRVGGLVNQDLWQLDLKEIKNTGQKDGWLIGEAEFDLSRHYRENNQYRFLLSLPYTELEKQTDGLAISEINLELTREPLTFKAFWLKLFNRLHLSSK